MSKKLKKASVVERDEQTKDSVYDFLYHDARRVGSFLSQFDDSGHLQQITQSESVNESKSSRAGATTSGSIVVVKGEASFQDEACSGLTQKMDRVYDPLWTNARTFLDFLEERGLVQRDLSKARIGQFVLSSGNLSIQQFALMQRFWELPTTIKLTIQSMKNTAKAHAPAGTTKEKLTALVEEAEFNAIQMLDTLPLLPHGPQAIISGDGFSVWGSLSEQYFTGSASDLILKHGGSIAGHWHMLSILDALPDKIEGPANAPFADVVRGMLGAARTLNRNMMLMARRTLGRPEEAYGATPLMIFREISG